MISPWTGLSIVSILECLFWNLQAAIAEIHPQLDDAYQRTTHVAVSFSDSLADVQVPTNA
jgi:hypothetical protein